VQVKQQARLLAVTCAGLGERRFGGMARVLAEMESLPGLGWAPRGGERIDLTARPGLEALILWGHGAADAPRLGDGAAGGVTPRDVRLPPGCRLYLLACHQGRADLLSAWAAGTDTAPGSVAGAEGETETLLSTLFLLGLREAGPGAVSALFSQWVLANRIIRPFFVPAREMYARCGGDPLPVLDWLEGETDLAPAEPLLRLARLHPEYVTGLLG
jgi:hypothetical protein